MGFINPINKNLYIRIPERLEWKMFIRAVGRGVLRKGKEFRYITRAMSRPNLVMRATFTKKSMNNNRIILTG